MYTLFPISCNKFIFFPILDKRFVFYVYRSLIDLLTPILTLKTIKLHVGNIVSENNFIGILRTFEKKYFLCFLWKHYHVKLFHLHCKESFDEDLNFNCGTEYWLVLCDWRLKYSNLKGSMSVVWNIIFIINIMVHLSEYRWLATCMGWKRSTKYSSYLKIGFLSIENNFKPINIIKRNWSFGARQ